MGSFYTSLHLDVSAVTPGVPAWLAHHARTQGLLPAAADTDAHRTVLLVPGMCWLSVYDDACDGQDPDTLDAVASGLSASAQAAVVVVTVHDSDRITLTRYEGGRKTDHFARAVGQRPANPAALDALLDRWAPWVRDPDAMRQALSHDGVMADQALAPLARALAIAPARLTTSCRYLQADGIPPATIRLAFRAPTAPSAVAGTPPRLRLDAQLIAPPPAQPIPALRAPPVAVGAPLHLTFSLRNIGGSGAGLQLLLAGSEQLVRWHEARLFWGPPGANAPHTAPVTDGRVDAPVLALPAGEPPTPPQLLQPAQLHAALKRRAAATLHVHLRGEALATGATTSDLTVRPSEPPHDGTTLRAHLEVRTTATRPLRADPLCSPLLLEPLDADAVLVALVVLEPDSAREHAAHLCAALRAHAPRTGRVGTIRYHGAMKAPTQRSVRADGYLGKPAFRKLLADTEACQVDVEWGDTGEDDPPEPVLPVRLAFGRGLIPSPNALPALAVGLRHDVTDLDTAKASLRAAIDNAAAAGGVVQALLTRWGQHITPDATPYEQAVGVMGQCTLERSWVERWVRAIGAGTLWLGPALAARCGEPAGLRLEVTDVASAEQRLADLLPSAEDWRHGIQRRYTLP